MKTSPELLTDILGVLGHISTKLDTMISSGGKGGGPGVGTIALGTYLGRGRGSKDKKEGSIGDLANSVAKLNNELNKLNMVKLNKLINTISTYEKMPKESALSKRTSNMASSAKEASKALLYMGVAVITFAAAFGIARDVLGISPYEVLGFIALTALTLAATMIIISGGDWAGEMLGPKILGTTKRGKLIPDKGRNKGAIENAKSMGVALMFIAGGVFAFSLSMVATGALLGVPTIVAPFAVAGMVVVLALSMLALSLLTSIGDMGKGGKGRSKDAIDNARNMGIALMFIAGGVLAFSISIALVPRILGIGGGTDKSGKNWGKAGVGLAAIILMIGAMAGIFVLLGLKPVQTAIMSGTATAGAIAGGMALISLGVLVVAFASKIIAGMMKEKETTTKTTTMFGKETTIITKNKSIFAGLGMFGLFVLAAAGSLWLLGLPMVSGPIMLGAGAMLAMSFALINTARAIKKVDEVMKTMDIKTIGTNISEMVSAVMGGVIKGVIGSGAMGTDEKFSHKELVQFRRVTRAIKMLSHVAESLSKFAKGLTAFSKVGEIMDLTYDKDGNPKTGKSVSVKQVATAVVDTFSLFIKTLVENTEALTIRQGRALKKLGQALGGRNGILSSIGDFASALETFAKFGKKGEIWIPVYDKNGQLIENKKESIQLTTVTTIITNVLSQFIDTMVTKAKIFEPGGKVNTKIKRLNKAVGGMLSGIGDFASALEILGKYGKTGKFWIPAYNEDGTLKKDKKGNLLQESVTLSDVTTQITNTFSQFIDAMVSKAQIFELGGGKNAQIRRLNEALMGTKGGAKAFIFGETPGILSAVTAFSDILVQYAKYGKDRKVPIRDDKGKLIDTMSMEQIADNIVIGISSFLTAFESKLGTKGELENKAQKIKDNISSVISIISQFDVLAKAQDPLQKLSDTLGSLAANIGLLVTNMGNINTTNLEKMADISVKYATKLPSSFTNTSSSGTTTSGNQVSQINQIDWDIVAEKIGQRVAEKMSMYNTGEFQFRFMDTDVGNLTIKR